VLGPVDLMTPPSEEAEKEEEEDDQALDKGREEESEEEAAEEAEAEGFDATSGAFNTGPINLDNNIYDPVTSGGDGTIAEVPEDRQ
jgi:hypothetical protein